RLATVGLGRPGTPPAGHYDPAARSSLHGSEGNARRCMAAGALKETEARPRVKNRHGGAPSVPPSTRTFLGAPPTPRCGVSEATMQTPGADMRRGNEMGCLTS